MVPDHVAQNCTTSHQRPSCGNLDHVRCRGSHVLRLYNRAPELRHDKVNMRPRAAVGCRRKQNAHLSPSPRIMPPFATDFTGFLKRRWLWVRAPPNPLFHYNGVGLHFARIEWPSLCRLNDQPGETAYRASQRRHPYNAKIGREPGNGRCFGTRNDCTSSHP
jgi:hypothetical protein